MMALIRRHPLFPVGVAFGAFLLLAPVFAERGMENDLWNMSLYAVAFFGGAPVGALLLGSLASLVGPVHAFALSGMGCLLCTLLFRRALPRLEARARSGERRLDPEKVGPEPLDLP